MSLWLVRLAQALVEAGACYGVMDLAAELADTLRAATALAAMVPKGAFRLPCSRLASAGFWRALEPSVGACPIGLPAKPWTGAHKTVHTVPVHASRGGLQTLPD